MTRYGDALKGLHRLESFGIRLGLDNVRAYCAAADHPERAYPSFHVAGTNGKGTTAACLAALAARHGLKTGLYTSPHVIDFRERIRVDGTPIGAENVAAGWDRIRDFVVGRDMTYFEATTLIALDHFALERVDLAIIEVGLGGRLDATNVVTPEAAIVTNIARDHEAHLGQELAAIAREKAGIFKPAVPALVGDAGPPAVRAALRAAGAEAGTRVRFLPDEVQYVVSRVSRAETVFDYASARLRARGLRLSMAGAHFAADAALALWAWEDCAATPLEAEAAREALADVAPAGRSQWQIVDGVSVVFDVAHNPAAVRCLATALEEMAGRRSALVIGVLADKDWPAMLDALEPIAARAWLCGLETARPERRLTGLQAAPELAKRPWVRWAETVTEGLTEAHASVAARESSQIVVTGSFHTVGEALLAQGLAETGEPYVPGTQAPAGAPS